jgi:hypothetical protein
MNKATENSIKVRMRTMQGMAKDFSKTFKEELKGKTQQDIDAAIKHVNALLTSQVMPSTSQIISPKLESIVLEMRKAIDDMSAEVNTHIDQKSKLYATISGNTFTLSNPAGDQRCVGSVLAPGDVTVGTKAIAIGRTAGGTSSNAVTVTVPARPSDVVVTVLQCNGQPPLPATATIGTDVVVVVAGRTVRL